MQLGHTERSVGACTGYGSRRQTSRSPGLADKRPDDDRALVPHSIHKRPQLARARGMSQFAERLGFDLADAFAGYCKRLADFFQSVLAAIFEAKAHLDNFFLARGQRAQDLSRLVLEIHVDHRFGW